ncbi:MAG: LD-carboxypeptidase [Cyanobacteria bacterium P01_F01_bin.153]
MLPKPCELPAALRPGDTLRVITPSGPLASMDSIQAGVDIWRSHGFNVDLGPDGELERTYGYLAGTDTERRQQLTDALTNPKYKGILCARGGYGATRLLEDFAWPFMAAGAQALQYGQAIAPKWLIGFSDITALLWSLANQGIASVHGPVLTTLPEESDDTRDRLFALVQGQPPPPLTGNGWGGGRVIGRLFPGNLAVATHILGTRHCPNLTDAILAFEDVGEYPYRLDRFITHWRNTGLLHNVAGIALGRFSQCDPPPNRSSLTTEELWRDRLGDLSLPIVSGLNFGHSGPNASLPVGSLAELDGDQGTLSLL